MIGEESLKEKILLSFVRQSGSVGIVPSFAVALLTRSVLRRKRAFEAVRMGRSPNTCSSPKDVFNFSYDILYICGLQDHKSFLPFAPHFLMNPHQNLLFLYDELQKFSVSAHYPISQPFPQF